jgi:hypothetical protein
VKPYEEERMEAEEEEQNITENITDMDDSVVT